MTNKHKNSAIEIRVTDNDIERAIKVWKQLLGKHGVLKSLRDNKFAQSKGEKLRAKRAAGARRKRKEQWNKN